MGPLNSGLQKLLKKGWGRDRERNLSSQIIQQGKVVGHAPRDPLQGQLHGPPGAHGPRARFWAQGNRKPISKRPSAQPTG
eukprot:3146060-Pyramimonas_sp.AAC.1